MENMTIEKRIEMLEASVNSLASIYSHFSDWLCELENITRKYNKQISREWYGETYIPGEGAEHEGD